MNKLKDIIAATEKEIESVEKLQKAGYLVFVDNLREEEFTKRYKVYQAGAKQYLKLVVVNNNGKILALQG